MRSASCLLACVWALLAGCSVHRGPVTPFPLKIGLLADSQITSQNGFSDFHFRSKTADLLVDVSIRPPGLERVLAEEMLEIAPARLTDDTGGDRDGVDVILYLGDGANSGGTDEIETVLRVLGEHRDRTGTPIFIVIGNHDYLGTGNIVSPGIRFALLNREGQPQNPALTKYDVLERFSGFNHANNRLPSNSCFRYVDNFSTVERNKHLDHDTGMYLGGVLTYAEEGRDRVQVLLLDSSDYKDAPNWSDVVELGFYGLIGSVSFKDEPGLQSQTSWLREMAGPSAPEFRMLASHYPKDHLDRITFAKPDEVPLDLTNRLCDLTEGVLSIPTFSKTLNQNLEPLLIAGERNYWVSGHTHASKMPRPDRHVVGGTLGGRYFSAVNVGSTTDYRAHVAIVERFEKHGNARLDDAVGYREIPLFDGDESLMAGVSRAIGAYGREHAGEETFRRLVEPMDEWIDGSRAGGLMGLAAALTERRGAGLPDEERYWIDVGAMMLGLSKGYREAAWGDTQTEESERHLRDFIDRFVDRTGSDREQVIACLGLMAGAYECGRLSGTCDFSPDSLRRIRTDPA